jgi:hypothetical protein
MTSLFDDLPEAKAPARKRARRHTFYAVGEGPNGERRRVRIVFRDCGPCPACGALAGPINPEAPFIEQRVNIRAFKVRDEHWRWWSQCLVCAKGDPAKGWFVDEGERRRSAARLRRARNRNPQSRERRDEEPRNDRH